MITWRNMVILAALLILCIALTNCAAPPKEPLPEGFVQLPITGRVVTEERACAIALAFKTSVSTGVNALSGTELKDALRPWGKILDAAYCLT